MIHQSKVFSDPLKHGPGRILYVTLPFNGNIDVPKDLQHIHDKALQTADYRRITGPLDQYFIYHSLLREQLYFIEDLLQDGAIPIFVPSLSRDMPYHVGTDESQGQEMTGKKRGVDPTSSFSDFGYKLGRFHGLLEEKIEEEYETGDFPDADLDKQIIYITVGPILTINYWENGLQNMFGDTIVQEVDEEMIAKGKNTMGRVNQGYGYEKMLFQYMPSFFDVDAAQKASRRPKHLSKVEFRNSLLEHTRYNRHIASYIYSTFMEIMPQDEVYLFLQKSSFLYEIAKKAAKRTGKKINETLLMRNVDLPRLAEAEDSALNIMGGYIASQILGKRKRLTMKSLGLGGGNEEDRAMS